MPDYNPAQAAGDEPAFILEAQRGSLDSFNALVLRYQDSVYNLAYRIMGDPASAADAVQETFITAYRRIDSFRGGSFRAWLLRIATNQCYDELRRSRRRPAVSIEALGDPESDDGPNLPDASETPEQVAQRRELNQAIQQCIDRLPTDHRLVLVLSDIEELNYQEIAEAVGTNVGTVKSRLSRARSAVRACLRGVEELLPSAYRLISND
jgi:RNA polymerase sigma factor (sigma-70 family)